MTDLRVVSYGGGVQSTALLVLAAQERIDFRTFLMANTGEDSEHPATLEYVRKVAAPFAEKQGIDLHLLDRVTRSGEVETLRGRIMREDRKSQVIPVRSSAKGPPMSRSCTMDFKIRRLGKWLKEHGASAKNPATVAIGISMDESDRANRKSNDYERIVYPLLDMPAGEGVRPMSGGGAMRPLRRTDCERIIREAGISVPPKSSCYFCPFHSINEWHRLRRDEPELFTDAALIEQRISEKAGSPRYLTRTGMPLAQAIPDGVDLLPFADDTDADCDSGWCMT